MNAFIPLYVTLQSFVQDRVDTIKERAERGATGFEYGALLLVSAAVIAVLIALVNDSLKTKVTDALNSLFQGGSN